MRTKRCLTQSWSRQLSALLCITKHRSDKGSLECAGIADSVSAGGALPDDVPDGAEEEEGDEVEGDRPENEPTHRKLDNRQEEIYAGHTLGYKDVIVTLGA